MKKLIAIAALTMTVIASPAFAQYNPGPTTGSASNQSEIARGGYYAANAATQNHQVAGQQSGLSAFAMVPRQWNSNSDGPALRMDREDF